MEMKFDVCFETLMELRRLSTLIQMPKQRVKLSFNEVIWRQKVVILQNPH